MSIPFVPLTGSNFDDRSGGESEEDETECESDDFTSEETALSDETVKNQSKGHNGKMEKTRADILIEKSKKNYSAAIEVITDLYDNVFSKDKTFKYDKRQLLAEYDCYLQAVLIKICAKRDRFLEDEMKFIENIADYGKLHEGTDYTLFAGCVKDMSDRLLTEAEERLKIIPVCFKLAGAVDSSKGTSSMRALLDCTVKIAFNLKFIDPSADLKDNSDVVSALKAVYAFARCNGINLK